MGARPEEKNRTILNRLVLQKANEGVVTVRIRI